MCNLLCNLLLLRKIIDYSASDTYFNETIDHNESLHFPHREEISYCFQSRIESESEVNNL